MFYAIIALSGDPLETYEDGAMSTTVHDSGYKRLFSNKTIFRQLIQTFVEEEWVPRLDFDRAERLDKSFVSEHYKETEYDLPLLLEKLLSLYDTEPDRQALMLFINWFRQLTAHGRLDSADFAQIEEQDLTREEVKSMLIKALERERETIRQEGFELGRKKTLGQIVQNMAAKGFSLETIAQLLTLSAAEVEQFLAEPVPTP